VVLLAVLLGACGSSGASPPSHPAAALQVMQLRPAEVPGGFYLAGRSLLGPDQSARSQGLDPGQYSAHGGQESLAVRFVQRHPTGLGLTFIFSQVFAFASASDAAWGFRQIDQALAHSGTIGTVQEPVDITATATPLPTTVKLLKHPVGSPATPYAAIRVPPLGNQDAGFTNTSAAYAGEYVFTNQVVLFRQGSYCGLIHISGNYGQVPLSAALALARRIDTRARRA